MATKVCYSFLIFDNSCHAYRTDDYGATWTFQQTTPLETDLNGFFDYAMATADGDYNTQVSFVNDVGADGFHFALTFSPTGNSNDWTVLEAAIAPVDTNKMEFVTGAISAEGQIILAPVVNAATTIGRYPRISYDSGATWASITTVPADRGWGPCCFTANTTKMYMVWLDGGDNGVSVSLDNGATWADLPGAPNGYFEAFSVFEAGQRLRCTPDGHGLIYNDSSGNALFSLNGGATWTIVNDIINVTTRFPVFVQNAANADCAISSNGRTMVFSFGDVVTDTYPYRSIFFISKDAGATWTELLSPSITDPGVGLGAYILFACNISPDGRALVATFQDDSFEYRVDMSLDVGTTWKSEDFTPFLSQIGSTWVTAFVFPNNQPPGQTSLFVASASDASGPTKNIMSSEDGATWALQNTPTGSGSVAYNGICYSQSLGIFCAVGNTDGSHQTAVMTSPDGVVWTFRNLPTLLSLNSVGWSEALGIFVAVGSGSDGVQFGYVFTSPDGVTWTKRTCPVGKWVSIASPPQGDFTPFIACSSAYNGTSFSSSVMHSDDGVTWTGSAGHASSTADGGWAAVIYAGWAASSANRFIAVGGDSTSGGTTGAIMYSGLNDPTSWTLATHPAHTACLGVAYEPKDDRVVAVGAFDAGAPTKSGALYSNNHGQTWSTYTPIEGKWDSLIWAFDLEMFVAVGAANGSSTNIVMTSPDGIAWTAQTTDASINAKSFSSVAYRQASPTEDACILVPSVTPKGGYIIERLDNRIWPTVENAWCVDCGFTLARPTPNADLQIQPVP